MSPLQERIEARPRISDDRLRQIGAFHPHAEHGEEGFVTMRHLELGGVVLDLIEARYELDGLRAANRKLREALAECDAVMVKPAHVFSCGAYKETFEGMPVGACTCGVAAAHAKAEAALGETI